MPTARLREIITKAVCGRSQKKCLSSHIIEPKHTPTEILGLRITGVSYTAALDGQSVAISGSYEVNVWYASHGALTDVVRHTAHFSDQIDISPVSEMLGEREARAVMVKNPRLVWSRCQNGKIDIKVETEFRAEVIAETKLLVRCLHDLLNEEKKFEDAIFADLDEDVLSLDDDGGSGGDEAEMRSLADPAERGDDSQAAPTGAGEYSEV